MGHFTDGARTPGEGCPGMGGSAPGGHDVARDAVTPGHQSAPFGGFRNQHKLVAPRLVLDALPGRRAADLLVGNEHEGHRKNRRAAGAQQLLHGVAGGIHAALHVVDARTVEPVPVAAERERASQGADTMHGIEMAENQDALVLDGAFQAGDEHVAVPVASRFAADGRSQRHHLGLGKIHHGIDTLGHVGGALDEHPGAEALQDLVHVEFRLVFHGQAATTSMNRSQKRPASTATATSALGQPRGSR